MEALKIIDLKKSFKSNFLLKTFRVLKNINLTVDTGEIYGFLGPNGAGKTTTIKCILSLISPDAGDIFINGKYFLEPEAKTNIGFLPENPYFYEYLTAKELLRFSARLFSISRKKSKEKIKELLKLVGLEGKGDTKLKKFSKGMIQRIGLAQSMISDPDLLILDEPFSGLDPIGRKELRDIIVSLKNSGKTIFFSSHILQDMEMMVDRVGIILNGEIIKTGKISELITHSVQSYELIVSNIEESILRSKDWLFELKDKNYIIKADKIEKVNEIIRFIVKRKGEILSVTPMKLTLEEIFLKEMRI